jgi:hypothetical protein
MAEQRPLSRGSGFESPAARVPTDDRTDEEFTRDWDRVLLDAGYIWCRPCADWHRPPECWITEDGTGRYDVDV